MEDTLLSLAKAAEEVSHIETGGAVSREEYEKDKSALERILRAFPLFYGLWVRLAHLVWSGTGDWKESEAVFMKAIETTSLKYSPEFMREFVSFASAHAGIEEARLVLINALGSIGNHFLSGPLWRAAIDIEKERENGRVLFVLSYAISKSTNQLKEFWDELQTVLPRSSVSELAALDLGIGLKELLEKPIEMVSCDEQEVRCVVAEKLKTVYESSLSDVMRRSRYENAITRTYFHYHAPDEAQIANWESYIQAMLDTKAEIDKITELFERALIPCYYIEDMWILYADFMEKESIEAAVSVYERIPFEVMPRARIIYAEFLEEHGNADMLYQDMSNSMNAEQILAVSSYLRRKGNQEIAVKVLRSARDRMNEAKDFEGAGIVAGELFELTGEPSDDLNDTSATYLSKVAMLASRDDPDKANTLLFNAIFQSSLLLEDKVTLLEIYLDYVRQWGTDAAFQMDMEIELVKMKNQVIWHKNYFEQSFLASNGPPENRLILWLDYQKSIPV